MPIVNFGQTIFIAHKIAGAHPHIQELGEMSLELAIWLEAELNRTLLRERGDTTTLTQNAQNAQNAQNNQDSTNTTDGITNFFGQPQIRAIVERAENAAERGYKPQLRDEYGNLTPEGRIKAELVTEIIREINEYRDNWAYSPMSWMQADEILLNATIPVRSLRMLQKLSTGIAEAEQAHTQGKLAKTIIPEEKDKKPHVGVMSIKDTRSHVATPNQAFLPEIYQVPTGTQAFVPTATFGQKARTDLRYLIRYGMVELKAYVTGRGRPKHIIRVSTPGERILLDLQKQGLI